MDAARSSPEGANEMNLRAFFLAPVPAAIIGGIVSWATGGFPRPIPVAIFYLFLLYGTQIILGLIIRAFLLRTNRRSPIQFGMGGLFMTGVPSALYLVWATTKHPASSANALFVFALWSVLGAMTGLCYWFLAQRHHGKPI
ncbi:hypothetical protein [Sphingobium sp. Leaf26]|uniref:hypothetical protein n=1 Tax=Sphingobium sp. Leaf26 TaxID=1735693 RepID=UPI00138F35A1|nr:hypothetical protein [Sphingobium sp. Leaf26]